MTYMNSDTMLELMADQAERARPEGFAGKWTAHDEIREWDHEQWTVVSDAFALVSKVLRDAGMTAEANDFDAVESALYAVWAER